MRSQINGIHIDHTKDENFTPIAVGLPTLLHYIRLLDGDADGRNNMGFCIDCYTGWPKNVSHYQKSLLNRIKNRH